MNFHLNVSFNGACVDVGAGLMLGKKKGDYWLENGPTETFEKKYSRIISTGGGGNSNSGGASGGSS